MQRLKGKVAIITGGGRGIGFVTAEVFAREGAQVVIWDVDPARGREAVEALAQNNLSVSFQKVNVTQLSETTAAAQAVFEQHGAIDILVNNAGITRDARLVKMTAEQWQAVLDVNLTGVFNCTKAVVEYMLQKGAGRILNAASIVGLYGNFGQSNYVATKAGVIGMTRVWARELGPKGITVNVVAPGFIATEMVETIPGKVREAIIARTPVGRFGQPEDVANAYLFLASEEAAFINGATLSVDGGATI